jgi:hypothetical protein
MTCRKRPRGPNQLTKAIVDGDCSELSRFMLR